MSTPQKSQGGNEGGGLGGLGHSGPLVTISSPSVIVKPLVAAQPPQPPPAYLEATPSHQHQQRPNPQTQQNPSRSVQPMYTVVDGDAIALLQYPHPTGPRTAVRAANCSPRPPGRTTARPRRIGSSGPCPPKPLPSESGDPTSESPPLPDPPQHRCWFSR